MPSSQGFQVVVVSDASSIRSVQSRIAKLLDALDYSDRDKFSVRLALEEALVNAIRHGNENDSGRTVLVGCSANSERIRIEIEDGGPGFCNEDVPSPILRENLMKATGRGLLLMREFMHLLEFSDVGNRLVMERNRESQAVDTN